MVCFDMLQRLDCSIAFSVLSPRCKYKHKYTHRLTFNEKSELLGVDLYAQRQKKQVLTSSTCIDLLVRLKLGNKHQHCRLNSAFMTGLANQILLAVLDDDCTLMRSINRLAGSVIHL